MCSSTLHSIVNSVLNKVGTPRLLSIDIRISMVTEKKTQKGAIFPIILNDAIFPNALSGARPLNRK